jgi:NitT/TauT family transport system substrate-binding protein
MLRANPEAHLKTVATAFKWEVDDARQELKKVHFANLPENLAFFAGTIDSAGSYGYIYESAVMTYGSDFIPRPAAQEKFLALDGLKAIEAAGTFKSQRAEIQPIRSSAAPVEEPLLARDIRFLFMANSSALDMDSPKNKEDLAYMARMLQVSPGSTLLLRGHVDNSRVKEFERAGPQFLQSMTLKAVQLSKERCESVRKALIDQHKVDAGRLESIGLGWKEPLGTDMEQNRRVEVQWFTLE